ncbi:MAG: 4-hydroxy-3-methylbut-2-enyl diphosphate reductase, partial [Desulfobacterales bacterium]|nr:4-hydroxy-3-methylbut-2-enyl diphosphate reductase [Desulfobacterales bacterium]
MKITVAKTAGFCMGVLRAVDMVLDASNIADEPIFTYGPLIHNPQVLEMLEGKQIFRLDTIPEKGEGVVLIRAHGVPPEDEKALADAGFTVINATCPRVVRVQVIINKFAKKGYATIIIGDKKHPEVVGLLGYARGKGHTVTSLAQLDELPAFENAVVVAQTTQNTAFYDEVKQWCATHRSHYKVFDTICGSTEKRQSEIRDLAQ